MKTPTCSKAFRLTQGQKTARLEILANVKPGRRYLLEGAGGVGKTAIIPDIIRAVQTWGMSAVFLAPTHKAVTVGAKRLQEAGLDVPCLTAQSYLGLRPSYDGSLTLSRRAADKPAVDVAVLDEGSLVGQKLWNYCDGLLKRSFILVTADFGQIQPVKEGISPTSRIPYKSILTEPVRQAEGNPILQVARAIRETQNSDGMDWSWCKPAKSDGRGVHVPGDVDAWLKKAFSSREFAADPDSFRFLAYTNARVAQINKRVHSWLYGETETPFVPGERVVTRQPVMKADTVIFNTNEEATVSAMRPAVHRHRIKKRGELAAWVAEIACWEADLLAGDGSTVTVYMPRDEAAFRAAERRILHEAASGQPKRKGDRQAFLSAFARLRGTPALTIHTAQGSTFGTVFLDVQDVQRCREPLEMKRILYTGASRPTTHLALVT